MEKLNIKNNGLKSIPHEFQGSLPRLAELNISGNRLETFPSLYWDDIKILDVSQNEVKSISTEALKTATSLETVQSKERERVEIGHTSVKYSSFSLIVVVI